MSDGSTATTPRHWMTWIRVGDDLPGLVVKVHLREARPTGIGTNSEEWLLVEWEELTRRKPEAPPENPSNVTRLG